MSNSGILAQVQVQHRIAWNDAVEQGNKTGFSFAQSIYNDEVPESPLYYTSQNITRGTISDSKLVITGVEVLEVDPLLAAKIKNKAYTLTLDIAEVRGKSTLNTLLNPIRINENGKIERLISFTVEYNIGNRSNFSNRNPPATFTSVLNGGDIYKISVNTTGIYKIDKTFLENKLGINLSTVDPRKIKIYGNRGGMVTESNAIERDDDLQELSLFASGESDGKMDAGDYFLFYAEGAEIWRYDDKGKEYVTKKNIYDVNNYYFIKIDATNGKRISQAPLIDTPASITLSSYESLQRYEEDKTNLLGAFPGTEGTGKDWYGDPFKTQREKNYSTNFDFSNYLKSEPIAVRMVFAGRAPNNSAVILSIGSRNINTVIGSAFGQNSISTYARRVNINQNILINDDAPTVRLNYPSVGGSSEGWLDFIQLSIMKTLVLPENGILTFRNKATIGNGSMAFDIQNYRNQIIWDVTNPYQPQSLAVQSNSIKFNSGSIPNEFVAHLGLASAIEPSALGKIKNQNIHSIEVEDMLVVYHPNFRAAAEKFVAHRTNHSGIAVRAVDVTQVYNEFSSGKLDPGAIRDMAKLLLSRNPNFRYMMLLGDGSYDYRAIVKDIKNENFIPVYETDESLDPVEGFPSDDFYGLLGENEGVDLVGGLDTYIGRLPARTVDEAAAMIDKIIHYETSANTLGDWRLRNGYSADDEDGNLHLNDMDDIAENTERRYPVLNQQKVYFDAFPQVSTFGENRYPDATKAINENIFKGQLTLTYLGHGGPLGWAQERVLTVPDIQNWTNYDAMTLMITATCSFASYDDPAITSPAEYAILNPKGGAIALFSTTRPVYTNSNKLLTDAALEELYKKENGQNASIGKVLTDGKNKYLSGGFRINSRKFALLGDPSLKIAFPKYEVSTSSINGKDANTFSDTLSAFEKVTISGTITDSDKNVRSGFNGTIYPTVYDKKTTQQTLANDGGSKINFKVYRNIIFKGAATVTNGQWSFSFFIPKNINYSIGNSRISYYASDELRDDAAGVYTGLLIGGVSKNNITDNVGPMMDIFMNDESFVFGGLTNDSPTLLLNLEDDFGINVTGSAIGQDITAILDNDSKNVFILNDFYEAAKDNFSNGKVRFPLKGLTKGTHSIVAKAWDISGNSTERRTEFLVANSGDDVLKHVLNYPNPFTTITNFAFEHDLANTDLEVIISIYSVTGKLVKTIVENKYSTGFRVNDVKWTGRDDFDSKLGRGLYLYKVKIRSKELNLTRESDFEKLIIL